MIVVRDGRGNQRVFAELAGIEGRTRRAIRQAWFGLAIDLKREANKEILRRPKGGRVYIVRSRTSGRPRRHVASAPGETHANMFGDLRRALSWKVHGTDSMEFGYGIVQGPVTAKKAPKHAPFVEFGTRRMAARPSLSNAIDATQADAEQHWEERMFKEFNR